MKKSVRVSLVVALAISAFAPAYGRDTMPMQKGSNVTPVADDSLVKKSPVAKKEGVVPVPAVQPEEGQGQGTMPKPFVAGLDTFGTTHQRSGAQRVSLVPTWIPG